MSVKSARTLKRDAPSKDTLFASHPRNTVNTRNLQPALMVSKDTVASILANASLAENAPVSRNPDANSLDQSFAEKSNTHANGHVSENMERDANVALLNSNAKEQFAKKFVTNVNGSVGHTLRKKCKNVQLENTRRQPEKDVVFGKFVVTIRNARLSTSLVDGKVLQ